MTETRMTESQRRIHAVSEAMLADAGGYVEMRAKNGAMATAARLAEAMFKAAGSWVEVKAALESQVSSLSKARRRRRLP